MLSHHLAIVSETPAADLRGVTFAAAAIQRQVLQDFGPLWAIDATVSAFASLDDVPVGYWPVIVETDIETPGAAGIHEDKGGQPFALIEYSNTWSLTASHEVLEMLADPWGRRVHAGQSVKPGQGRVEFLVEVCDPCETAEVGYHVNWPARVRLHHAELLRSGRESCWPVQLHRRDHGAPSGPRRRLPELA
jgi:hypothetical protein